MNLVKLHFIVNNNAQEGERIRTKVIPLTKTFPVSCIRKNLGFVTIEDINKNVRCIFVIKDKLTFSERKVGEFVFISLKGEDWSWRIDCRESTPFYILSMYTMSRVFRLLRKNCCDNIHVLIEKIDEYCDSKYVYGE